MYVSRCISWKNLYNAFKIKFDTSETFIIYYKDYDNDFVALIDELDKEQAFIEYQNLKRPFVEFKLVTGKSLGRDGY
jgi:hypothetical protein